MIRNLFYWVGGVFLAVCSSSVKAQGLGAVTLNTSPYTENFDGIGAGLPAGFNLYANYITVAPGTLNSATSVSWVATGGQFANFAAATLGSSATTVQQAAATDRALGIKQTGAFGDAYAAFVFKVANTQNKTGFKLDFDLQSLNPGTTAGRTTTWSILYKIGNASSWTTLSSAAVSGTNTTALNVFSNNHITADFAALLDNSSDSVVIAIASAAATTGSGSRPTTGIDNFSLSWTAANSTAPSLSLTQNGSAVNSIGFPMTAIGASRGTSYILNGTNLTGPATITATAPYTVSLDSVTFSNLITVPQNSGVIGKTIFVKFSPVSNGSFSGTVTNTATGVSPDKTITLSGISYDSTSLHFDFNNSTVDGEIGYGFTTYNTQGTTKWTPTTYGNNSTNGVNINAGTAAPLTDAWLISPSLHFSSLSLPVLSFYSRGEYSGPALELLISTDYDGSSNPANFTWNSLNANFPPNNNVWTFSDGINLSAYKSAANVYIAYRYSADPENGATRWTLDDIDIDNRTTLLSVAPNSLSFGEVAVGSVSAGQSIAVQTLGYGDVTATAPNNFQVSLDSATYTSSVVIPEATGANGTKLFVRMNPTVKQVVLTGKLAFTNGTTLNNDTVVSVTGTSYPRTETFDVAAYNLNFFGAGEDYSFTPAQIMTQMNNIKTVIRHLDIDVMGFEEMSNDTELGILVDSLNNTSDPNKHYASFVSDKWSYSFNPPQPTYPGQKIGFLYNTTTMTPSTTELPRVMFSSLYDSLRAGTDSLLNYPTSSNSFWSSGRLPYMATFIANVNGVSKKIRIVVIHSKAGSDAASYNRRVYDVKVLKDSLDTYYPNDNVLIVGDFNDRVYGSIYTGHTSPYKPFIDDATNYQDVTYPLDVAGQTSFIGGSGLIDHITMSKGFFSDYISNSAQIENTKAYIPNYGVNTASDHYPIFARFVLQEAALPVRFGDFSAALSGRKALLRWTTSAEQNVNYYSVQKSTDGKNWYAINKVLPKANNANVNTDYQADDNSLVSGNNFYRIVSVDYDSAKIYSDVRTVVYSTAGTVKIFPNPTSNFATISFPAASVNAVVKVTNLSGIVVKNISVGAGSTQYKLNVSDIAKGIYFVQVSDTDYKEIVKIVVQ